MPILRRTLSLLIVGAVLAATAMLATLAFAPQDTAPAAIAPPVDRTEQARTIASLRPGTATRPVVALLALNRGTEVADLLTSYGVLREGDGADAIVVAETGAPIRLYPGDLRVLPQATFAAFDRAHPQGADYVVVPAQAPYDDPAVRAWLLAQRHRGARVVSICNGSQTLAAAGLLDGRRATSHWSTVQPLREAHPTMRWVRDRRYVVDRGVATSTGVSSSLPLMLALVEATGGEAAAARTARALAMPSWDARHATAAFRLTNAHRWTYLRNRLRVWRHRDLPLAIAPDIDEIALGLAIDAYSRTEMRRIVSVAPVARVRSRHGLVLLPARIGASAPTGIATLPPVPPGRALDATLARIAAEIDARTARYVALTLEYPWRPEGAATR